jgi:hypothetical protein
MDYTKEEHRLLVEHPQAAQDFIDSTRENSGASIFLKDARLPAVGSENMFVVGKEISQKTKKSVPTQYENRGTDNRNLSAKQFASHFLRLKGEATRPSGTVKPQAMMGSWIDQKNPKKGIQMDLSVGLKKRGQAEKKMIERNEDAIFDVKNIADIRHEDVRHKYTDTPRPPKED